MGETINGYLTLPKGVAVRNLPVVVNPHGGPWLRDSWGYNPEVQFLANRGYAVLQMNFRGSTDLLESTFRNEFRRSPVESCGKSQHHFATWLSVGG